MGLIYKCTSPSGKSYIGQTIFNEQHRWTDHCCRAYRKQDPGYNYKLSRAIRKYGKENFTIEILENNLPKELLNEREKYWINFYDTFLNGYNQTLGGEGNLKIQDEEILNLWKEGLCCVEIAEKLKVSRKIIEKRIENLPISKEERKIRAFKKSASKQSLQQDKIDLILSFWNQKYNITDIEQLVRISRPTISKILKQNNISQEEINKRGRETAAKKKSKPIDQFNLNGEYIQTFSSIKEASQKLKIYERSIYLVLTEQQESTHNYIFRYKD